MTALRDPDLPERVRGTFAGLADPRVIDHLVKLGVTAVELMPVQAFFDDRYLVEKRLTQLLGLQHPQLLRAGAALSLAGRRHRRVQGAWCAGCTRPGIEVILDVVYNHTAEGNHLGPTLSFRGIDNASYYHARRRPALLFRHDRLRQHGQPAPSAGAADGHGFAALLGRGVPCRRLPLRPRHVARPRARPLRSERRLLRRRPPGPGPAAA